jgi:N-acetyl-anhydromuramyl-L-alanine amidase AmpD
MKDYSAKKKSGKVIHQSVPAPVPVAPAKNLQRFRKILIRTGIALILLTVIFFTGSYFWKEKRWRYIVVHHTASSIGNLEYFRRVHMEERGWSDIAYHFVINNGTSNTAMGQIEESSLWTNRLPHLSTRITYLNYFGIAVVMVGNFEKNAPPPLQREALINLLANLAEKYNIPPERIVGHREVSPTACPGKFLNMAEVRRDVTRILAKK